MFGLDDHLGDGTVVLAFFPGAFTPPCSNEMVALQERIDRFEDAGATLFGVSADSSFSQSAFADEYDLEFELVSDMPGDAIEAYGLSLDIPDLGLNGAANRAVIVIDDEGTVTYRWVAENPMNPTTTPSSTPSRPHSATAQHASGPNPRSSQIAISVLDSRLDQIGWPTGVARRQLG